MDFKDQIKQLGDRVNKLKDQIGTEEATKNAFIMPFIQCLGYDVFNPLEVVPEFTADLGIKQGEKVDYAILRDSKPVILIECKHWSAKLDPHNSQLFRYFHTTSAKFGLLSNGIEYKFYTDLVDPNKMDEKPFFIFNINEIKEAQVEELKKFHKNYYNHETIVSTASELKYTAELKSLLAKELATPSPDFVKHFAKQIYPGIITQKILDLFTELTKKSFSQFLTDSITDRLKSALTKESEVQKKEDTVVATPVEEIKIETTVDELESFQIVRSIARSVCPVKMITHRDAQSYFAILYNDNNRKPICRMYLNGGKKYIAFFDDAKKEIKKEIASLDDIFSFSDNIISSVKLYMKQKD